ncbi:contractile injection system protein, VgrG/Pvc8 family, partial [Xanthomonas oryzae]
MRDLAISEKDASSPQQKVRPGTGLPARAITTQYRESDWDFATRLLADAGL